MVCDGERICGFRRIYIISNFDSCRYLLGWGQSFDTIP